MKLIFSLVIGLLVANNVQVHAQEPGRSDESGTLVIVGRSSTGVVISVDSADTEDGKTIVAGSHKLLDVGRNGACAIDGFLGYSRHQNVMADEMRKWIRANPAAGPRTALPRLLKIAAESWDREHYSLPNLPEGRTPGIEITRLSCGDLFVDGPGIIRGWTVVAPNGNAAIDEIQRDPSSFEFAGVFGGVQQFIDLIQKGELPPTGRSATPRESQERRETYFAIRGNFSSNFMGMNALNSALVAEMQMQKASGGNIDKLPFPPSPLAEGDQKALLTAVYKSVEANMQIVRPPNNVRIIRLCGRFAATVESAWGQCPDSKPNRTQRTKLPANLR